MENMEIILAKLYRMSNLIIKETETPWFYGVDFPLYHAEVRLLDAIKTLGEVNVSELARHLGMTSGAISQITKKLLDKELIETYKKPGNRKEVFSRPTPLGEVVCRGHQKHHENMVATLRKFVDRLDEKEAQAVFDFLDAMNQGIEDVITKVEHTV